MARLGKNKVLAYLATLYVNLFRSVPLVMVILWFYLIVPQGLKAIFGNDIGDIRLTSALVAFALFEAAYYSEIIRAGIQSVPRGQVSAGLALGMTQGQTMRLIVLPQAFVVAMPAFFTYYLKTIKLLALVFTVKVVDMFAKADIFSALYNRRTEPYIADAIAYWAVAILLTLFFNWWEKRLRSKGF